MTVKQIERNLAEGKVVVFRVRTLRGYTHGHQSITFHPGDKNIAHRLKCFRYDEKPYDNPEWIIQECAVSNY